MGRVKNTMKNNDQGKFWEFLLDNAKEIMFFCICWFLGIRFSVFGYINLDFLKIEDTPSSYIFSLAIGIVLVLLPFFKRVKIGNIEVERELKQAKKELSEFKEETRNNFTFVTTQISAVANISNNNQFTVYLPGYEEAEDSIEEVSPEIKNKAQKVKEDYRADQEEGVAAILMLRRDLEIALREALKIKISEIDRLTEINRSTSYRLTQLFMEYYPEYSYLQDSFDFVRRAGNAVAHTQKISEIQIEQALNIGVTLLATIEDTISLEKRLLSNQP